MRMAILAAMMSAFALSAAAAGSKDSSFYRELDANNDGSVDQTEFDIQKGTILYAIDSNHNLKIDLSETRLSAEQFRQYAGKDGVIDGLELFDLPSAQFEAFDQNGDQQVTPQEMQRQLAVIRRGPQTAEGR